MNYSTETLIVHLFWYENVVKIQRSMSETLALCLDAVKMEE